MKGKGHREIKGEERGGRKWQGGSAGKDKAREGARKGKGAMKRK